MGVKMDKMAARISLDELLRKLHRATEFLAWTKAVRPAKVESARKRYNSAFMAFHNRVLDLS